jgi:hypothetical protein
MVRLDFTARVLLTDIHVTVALPSVKEGRSQGGGRKPSRESSGVLRMRAESHGAWPWGDPCQDFRPLPGSFRGRGNFVSIFQGE